MEKKLISKNPRRWREINESTTFRFPHLVFEETEEVWIHIRSGYPSTLAIPILMEKCYPGYKTCLCDEKKFLELGGKL